MVVVEITVVMVQLRQFKGSILMIQALEVSIGYRVYMGLKHTKFADN